MIEGREKRENYVREIEREGGKRVKREKREKRA